MPSWVIHCNRSHSFINTL